MAYSTGMLPDILAVPDPAAKAAPRVDPTGWMMAPAERAAVKGVLNELRPGLAIEIGTAEGGSLRRIAAAAGHVHAFDLLEPNEEISKLSNVSFHTGDCRVLLPQLLAKLSQDGQNVDFVLVDGDHTPEGVRRDVEDLLASPAISRTLILLHDTANPEVRAGLDAIDYQAWPRVAWVDLDWLPGYLFRDDPVTDEVWCGLGIVLVDADMAVSDAVVADYAVPMPALLRAYRSGRQELQELGMQLAGTEQILSDVVSSASWRVTAPLRALKRVLRP